MDKSIMDKSLPFKIGNNYIYINLRLKSCDKSWNIGRGDRYIWWWIGLETLKIPIINVE